MNIIIYVEKNLHKCALQDSIRTNRDLDLSFVNCAP